MKIPELFKPESVGERVENNVALCDRCSNYQTLSCPCGRFDRKDSRIREALIGLSECCDFDYFYSGQQEFNFV